MSTRPNRPDRISELLAAYGSDLSRWPEDDRQAMAALSPEERAARLREDVAFDQLITGAVQAANKAPASDALIARILSATSNEVAESPAHHGNRKVIDLRPAASSSDIVSIRPTFRKRDWTAAAALLAASLVLGVFVGSTERGQSTAVSIGDFAGLNVSGPTVQTTALDEALQAQDDEDIL